MEKSLFHKKDAPEPKAPDPFDLINKEIGHLKKGKGTSIRHGPKGSRRAPNLLVVLGFCGLAWLYLLDPFYHAWYKGDAVRDYLYLRDFGGTTDINNLSTCGILDPEDIDVLNHRTGSFRDYYVSPDAAKKNADEIVRYMNNVRLLHAGKYQELDPVGRLRYAVFIKFGIVVPTRWNFLDPAINP